MRRSLSSFFFLEMRPIIRPNILQILSVLLSLRLEWDRILYMLCISDLFFDEITTTVDYKICELVEHMVIILVP